MQETLELHRMYINSKAYKEYDTPTKKSNKIVRRNIYGKGRDD